MGIKVTGVDKIEARLKRLIVAKMVKQALINTVTAGAEVLLEEAQSRISDPDGVGMQITKKRVRKAEAQVGPTRAKWYLRFVETGAARHEIKGKPLFFELQGVGLISPYTVDHPGMAAHPFLRPAMVSKGQAAMDAAGAAFWKTLFKGNE